ncbi:MULTISPECIES: DUF3124 domain-containing protein [Desulfococcus]|uniref:DUF3124 domain-containing protein n=1 Tax=Desulfococcus multivorans DSM 2059 TaxID=1121405 RepID=S7UZS8_DESML|nr:DUF3124 domain-containing protein [Desulfococcus multivorans]AOY60578.1 conserved uncharacterized protein, DUF3124 [Desulfococcus multivorans]AQV02675.1 hypothetical protein B2D07_19085 [Desulfococcus multivorans]EPR39714.1 Protein of unknown function DUF3124 [Desulfococcus multivorans DSM 2059]SKA04559.1 Protein of unknown function [Desulfococcus multivorans DSM 2059]
MTVTQRRRPVPLLPTTIFLLFLFAAPIGSEEIQFSRGQALYIPVYSHIFIGNREMSFNLSANLSIRNTDPDQSLTITSVRYYDSDGKLVKEYLADPKPLKPMGSAYFFIPASDTSGGWGANFIVTWSSRIAVNTPIIECVMTGIKGSHSLSFITRGKPIRENTP